MNPEQRLIRKWRNLSLDKQRQVLQFVESLNEQQPKQTELGQRLRHIRAKIVASGEPLLNKEEIEREVTNLRQRIVLVRKKANQKQR